MSAEEVNIAAIPKIVCDKCNVLMGIIKDYRVEDYDRTTTDFNAPPQPQPVIGRYAVNEVQASGLNGCHVCSIISQALCPAHSERDILTSSTFTITIHIGRRYQSPNPGETKGSTHMLVRGILKDSAGHQLQAATLNDEPTPYFGSLSEPLSGSASWSISTGSDATFDLARNWLNQCLSQHELCEEIRATPVSSKTSQFPTYLVNVNPDHLHLCHSKDLPDRPQYLTLSHRWGGSQIFRLTSQNITTLLSDIPVKNLPKTFRDAIDITRRLGYRYIWIDSLCIIQDSVEHWRSESAIMGDIYRGSTCTIAALGATDGDSGCFKTRNPLCFQNYPFKLHSDRTMYMTAHRERIELNQTGYGPRVEPLHQRAWVIQERMLSPRTIFYGTFGIYWECGLKTVESNLYTDMRDSREGPDTTKYALHQTCNLTVTGQLDETYETIWMWWRGVILMYNPCGLTYGSDKLVAIAGIVKLVESKTGLHNIAGLWKEYIFPELLWTAVTPLIRDERSYQAPTWSWASLNGKVNPGMPEFDYSFDWKIELLDAVANLAAENGQLSSAYIRVRGPLMRVRWELVENGYKLRWGTNIAEENSPDDGVTFQPDVEPELDRETWALLIAHATSSIVSTPEFKEKIGSRA